MLISLIAIVIYMLYKHVQCKLRYTASPKIITIIKSYIPISLEAVCVEKR